MPRDRYRYGRQQLSVVFKVGAMGDLSDGQLLERFKVGDGEAAELAFTLLVKRHGSMVLNTCQSILRNAEDANDAFQATFMVLARRAGSLRAQETVGPWLHQVAVRSAWCARATVARRRRHERRAAELAEPCGREDIYDDLGLVIQRELDRLPERYRAAVVLCCLEGLTADEAARQLGWPAGTVRSRLARGRDQLRTRLIRYGLAPAAKTVAAVLMPKPARASMQAALVHSVARDVARMAVGQVSTSMAVSTSVTTLTKGAMKAMFLLQCQRQIAVLFVFGVLVMASAGLAQPQSERGNPEGQNNPANQGVASPSLKFEIRSWKDGKESGKPITVEMPATSSYTFETPDAIVQIRPHQAGDRSSQVDARVKELQILLQREEEKTRKRDEELLKFQLDDLIKKALRQDEQMRQEARKARGEPAGKSAGSPPRSDAESETTRRLEKLEQQLDEVIKTLRSPKAETPTTRQ